MIWRFHASRAGSFACLLFAASFAHAGQVLVWEGQASGAEQIVDNSGPGAWYPPIPPASSALDTVMSTQQGYYPVNWHSATFTISTDVLFDSAHYSGGSHSDLHAVLALNYTPVFSNHIVNGSWEYGVHLGNQFQGLIFGPGSGCPVGQGRFEAKYQIARWFHPPYWPWGTYWDVEGTNPPPQAPDEAHTKFSDCFGLLPPGLAAVPGQDIQVRLDWIAEVPGRLMATIGVPGSALTQDLSYGGGCAACIGPAGGFNDWFIERGLSGVPPYAGVAAAVIGNTPAGARIRIAVD